MPKDKAEVKTNGRAVFYAVLWPDFRRAALDCGYALALHGSMSSDMDMIAVPWTEDAKSQDELVRAISDCIGATIWKDRHTIAFTEKPHGRTVYTLSIMGDYYIDLSVTPKIKEA